MLNVLHLRTLREVLRTGTFAEAAGNLGYTRAAVSQQIAALERSTGLSLFDRGARSVRPTDAALRLMERGEVIIARLEALEREVRAVASGSRGTVRLGSFPTASAALLPSAFGALRRARPDVDIVLDEDEPDALVRLVPDGSLDLALVYAYDLVPRSWPSNLERVELMRERLVLLLHRAHPLAGESRLRLEDLAGETWISSREETDGAVSLGRMCAAAGFVPQVAFRSNDYDVIQGFVRAGLGVAVIPPLALVPDPSTAVHRLPAIPRRRIFVIHRPDAANPVLAPMLEALVTAARAVRRRAGVDA